MQNREKPLHFSLSPQKAHLLPGKNPEAEGRRFRRHLPSPVSPTSAITPGMMGAPDPGRIIPASHPGTTDTTGYFHTVLRPLAPQEATSTAGPERPRQNEIKPRQINGKRPLEERLPCSISYGSLRTEIRNRSFILFANGHHAARPHRPTAIPAQERHWRDGISGTRVMQPANNAIIQTPALPRLSRSNCSADKKSPSGNPAPTPAGTFHASAGVSTGKNKPGGLKRGRSFPKASSAGKSVPNSLGQGPVYGFMEQEDLEACKAELSISTASQNTPTAIRPKTQAPATEENVHCQLPPLRLFPASTNQRPQRAADGTGANAPLFFPGGLSSGIQVGPHHHGMRKWLRLHYGKV